MTNQEPRAERGMTKLIIPSERGELVNAWSGKGPGKYQNIGNEILKDVNGLRL